MNIKYIFILALLSIIILVFPSNPFVEGAALYVDPTQTVCPGAYLTVADAVATASDGNVIYLCNDVMEDVSLLNIGVSVTIVGNGYTWIVNDTTPGTYSISIVNGKTVVLKNITVILQKDVGVLGDYVNAIGVGSLSRFEIYNSYIESRHDRTSGSQVVANYAEIIINSSRFYASGSGIRRNFHLTNSNLTLFNSTFYAEASGRMVEGVFTDSGYDYNITMVKSKVERASMAYFFTKVNNVNFYFQVEDSNITARYDVIDFDNQYNANIYSYFENTFIKSVKDDAIDTNVNRDTNFSMIFKNCRIWSDNEAIYFHQLRNSRLMLSTDLTILNSSRGTPIYINDVTENSMLELHVADSVLEGRNLGLTVYYVTYGSRASISLENVSITSKRYGLYIYTTQENSIVNVSATSLDISSYRNAIDIDSVEYNSTVLMYVDPSFIYSEIDYSLEINYVYLNSEVEVIFAEANLTSPNDDAIRIYRIENSSSANLTFIDCYLYSGSDNALDLGWVWYDSNFTINIYSCHVESEWENFEIDNILYDSRLQVNINPSTMYSHEDEVFYINDVDYQSYAYLNIFGSELLAPDSQTIEFEDADVDSEIHLYIEDTRLQCEDGTYTLEIDLDSTTSLEAYIYYSVIGSIYVEGGDSPRLWIYESVVNEVGSSISAGTLMYMEWTIGVDVTGATGLPIRGAQVNFFNGSAFIGSSFTDSFGIAYFTFRYYYNNNISFGDLSFTAIFQGGSETIRYVDFNRTHTLPSWYYTFNITLPMFLTNVPVYGRNGFGYLTLGLAGGTIVLSNPYSQNVKVYQLRFKDMMDISRYTIINIDINIDSVWCPGYILMDWKDRMLIIRAPGIKLYGFF